MYSSMYSSTGLPILSAGATIEPSLFGDFPADGQDQLPDPVLSSDSSAEDDLTLGPDPDSADQGAPPGLSYAQHSHLAPQHSVQHSGSHLMAGMVPHMSVSSHPGMNPNLYSQMAHSSYQHSQASQHGHPNGNGMLGGSRAQMIIDPGPQYNFQNSQHMQSQPYNMQILSANSELPNPSIRQKRGSVEQISPMRYAPHSPNGPHPSSQNYASSSPASPPSTPARRRSSTASRGSLDSANSHSPGTPGSESGYFYRSRDKTNYQQAHKGVIPNPPTPEGSKRIRCTWTLEETRYLYDILKDATVEAFPDAHVVRAALLKVDPHSNKTLDHVRNKKANLIQKAHSRTCSVADVLIADMNKLENESTGSNRNTQALVQARDRDLALANAIAMGGAPTSTSSSPSLSTATSGSSASNGSGAKGGDYGRSSSLNDSDIKVGATSAAMGAAARGKQTAAASASSRGNRRRGGKRSATNSYSNTSAVAPTSTAQQLANLSGTSRSSFDKGVLRSGNGASSPPATSPISGASLGSGVASPLDPSSELHNHPRVTLTTTASASASDTGGITIGALSPSEYEPHHNHHHAAGLTLLTPPMTEDLSAEHTASVTKSIAGEPSAAALASLACADHATPSRFQNWVQDCMTQLFASNNEIRSQLGLQSIQLPTAPTEALTSTSGTHTALPRTEQWITSWATTGSSSSPVPSLLGPAVGAPIPPSLLSGSPVLTHTSSPTEREKSPSDSIDAKSGSKPKSERMDVDDTASPINTQDSIRTDGELSPDPSQ